MLRLGFEAVDNHPRQKYIFRKVLQAKFRSRAATPPAPQTVQNTLRFLQAAADTNGLERRCIASILHTEASRHGHIVNERTQRSIVRFNDDFYESVVNNINETMDMCL